MDTGYSFELGRGLHWRPLRLSLASFAVAIFDRKRTQRESKENEMRDRRATLVVIPTKKRPIEKRSMSHLSGGSRKVGNTHRRSSGLVHSSNSRAFTTWVCRHSAGKWRLLPVTR